MIRDILRFNREAPRLLEWPDDSLRLGDYLDAHGYSPQFVEHYILPMGAAIWSAGTDMLRLSRRATSCASSTTTAC